MPREFEPLLTRLVRSGTLVASTLTAIDVDFDFGPREGAHIYAMLTAFEPSAFANADDYSAWLVGRPGYQVITATDFLEPAADPDVILGRAYRTSFSTNGGNYQQLAQVDTLPEPYLLMRNLSAVFFDDNAVEHQLVIYYKVVELLEGEIFAAIARGRR